MATEVFHPVANTVEVVLKAQRGGRRRENVIHYNYANNPPSEADLAALLEDIDNSIIGVTGQLVVTSSGTYWFELTAKDINAPAGVFASRTVAKNALVPEACAPGNVALCLTKRTGIAAPWARGRYYLFDCPEPMFDDDQLAVGYLPRLTVLANHLLATRNGGQFIPAVASRTRALSNIITAITWDFVADSQRRRLTGRGI